MKQAVSPIEMKEIDRWAIEGLGIPSVALMEQAGYQCAQVISAQVKKLKNKNVLVVCGRGGNGGDGFVVVRWLGGWGAKVKAVLLSRGDDLRGDTATNFKIIGNMGIPFAKLVSVSQLAAFEAAVKKADIIVDAIFGFGFRGEVVGLEREVIEVINQVRSPRSKVFAIDVPSGLNAGTGEAGGVAVKADMTITLHMPKTGLLKRQAKKYVGKLVTVDIGIPRRNDKLPILNVQ